MTQYQQAHKGDITPEMTRVAERENLSAESIRDEVAAGRLMKSEAERMKLVRRLSNEALQDTNADATCVGPAGVLRLNTLGRKANTD